MSDVLLAIRPEWWRRIASGEKTVELRKSVPKQETPFRVFCYETKQGGGRGMVVGEFICDEIYLAIRHPDIFARHPLLYRKVIDASCLTDDEALQYSGEKDVYGWRVENPKAYETPRELRELGIKRAPQSWCYVKAGDS